MGDCGGFFDELVERGIGIGIGMGMGMGMGIGNEIECDR